MHIYNFKDFTGKQAGAAWVGTGGVPVQLSSLRFCIDIEKATAMEQVKEPPGSDQGKDLLCLTEECLRKHTHPLPLGVFLPGHRCLLPICAGHTLGWI